MPVALAQNVEDVSSSQASLCARCHTQQAVLVLRTEHLCQYVALPYPMLIMLFD